MFEKNFALCATTKINILTLVLSEKIFLNETKNHNTPTPCKLNGRSLSNIWGNQGNFNPKWHSLSLKQKLFDQFQQKWRSNMNNSSKGLCCKKN
jgi:hypothetical protein